MKLYHSWSCSDTWVNMYLTPAINATMKASWSAMGLIRHLDAAAGHANKGTGCSDSPQPDMIMNFTGSVVTSQVLTAATNSWNIIAVGFSARDSDGTDESTQSRWKKFYPANAKLIVDYDAKPSKPTGLQVSGVSCPAGAVGIGTLTPTFSSVYPDADSGQTLTGTYEWIEVPSGGIGTVTDTYPVRKTPPPPAPATANGRGEVPVQLDRPARSPAHGAGVRGQRNRRHRQRLLAAASGVGHRRHGVQPWRPFRRWPTRCRIPPAGGFQPAPRPRRRRRRVAEPTRITGYR